MSYEIETGVPMKVKGRGFEPAFPQLVKLQDKQSFFHPLKLSAHPEESKRRELDYKTEESERRKIGNEARLAGKKVDIRRDSVDGVKGLRIYYRATLNG